MKKNVFPLIIAGIGATTLLSGIIYSTANLNNQVREAFPFAKLQNGNDSYFFPDKFKIIVDEINVEINSKDYNLYSILKNKIGVNFQKLDKNLEYKIVIDEKQNLIFRDEETGIKTINNVQKGIGFSVKILNTKTNHFIRFLKKGEKFEKDELKIFVPVIPPFKEVKSWEKRNFEGDLINTLFKGKVIKTPTSQKIELFEIHNLVATKDRDRSFSIIENPKKIDLLEINSVKWKNNLDFNWKKIFEIRIKEITENHFGFNIDAVKGGGVINLKISSVIEVGLYIFNVSMIVEGIKYTKNIILQVVSDGASPSTELVNGLTQLQLDAIPVRITTNSKENNTNFLNLIKGKTKEEKKTYFQSTSNKLEIYKIFKEWIPSEFKNNVLLIEGNIDVSADVEMVTLNYGLKSFDKDGKTLFNYDNKIIIAI